MARGALSKPDVVAAITKDFVPVLVDFDTEHDWVQRHNVSITPTIHWTDADGETWGMTVDVQPESTVLDDLRATLKLLDELGD